MTRIRTAENMLRQGLTRKSELSNDDLNNLLRLMDATWEWQFRLLQEFTP